MKSPLRHISMRVPWQDKAWTGTVCDKPSMNSACLCLENIGAKKNEEAYQVFDTHRRAEAASASFESLPSTHFAQSEAHNALRKNLFPSASKRNLALFPLSIVRWIG